MFACTIMVEAVHSQIIYVVPGSPLPTVSATGSKRHRKEECFTEKLTVPQVAMVERELKRQILPPIGDKYYGEGGV